MRRAGVIFVIAPLAGCFLLVDSSPTGDQFTTTCNVLSPASACGTCIDTKCSAQLSACCGEPGCRGMLASLDQCADGGACTLTPEGDAGAPLAACVTSSCPSCAGTTTTSDAPSSGINCYADNISGTCDCSVTTSPNTTSCNSAAVGGPAICCADSTYPQSGGCHCAAVTCSIIDTGLCTCSLGNGGTPGTQCDESTGNTCCLDSAGTTCECISNGTCNSGTEVASCSSVGYYGCPSNKIAFTSCR